MGPLGPQGRQVAILLCGNGFFQDLLQSITDFLTTDSDFDCIFSQQFTLKRTLTVQNMEAANDCMSHLGKNLENNWNRTPKSIMYYGTCQV